ncbi:hypothetical protein CWD77_07035 [Rhodohalobacter barkolensis]|uniref:Uncharacterized protein n=1 Tax=Rhodohalobacter barkolensis TaxID=2053187 RepID=A0A2N0VLX4_9BACT|nr:hypothetical protein CWD77_07035 [Rhodohalobacter barkolensis]
MFYPTLRLQIEGNHISAYAVNPAGIHLYQTTTWRIAFVPIQAVAVVVQDQAYQIVALCTKGKDDCFFDVLMIHSKRKPLEITDQ